MDQGAKNPPFSPTTNATNYDCIEGNFRTAVGVNGCKNTDLGAEVADDGTAGRSADHNAMSITGTGATPGCCLFGSGGTSACLPLAAAAVHLARLP